MHHDIGISYDIHTPQAESKQLTEAGDLPPSLRDYANHYCNFGTTSRSILPDLRLAIGIIRGEKIRDSGTVWETGKSIAN